MTSKSKVYQVSDETFKKIIANANSYSDCLRALGLTTHGGSSLDVLKRRISELKCSTEHFGTMQIKSPNAKYDLDEILVENSTYAGISRLKIRLVNEGRLEYKCAYCGNIGEWQGQKLTLQLDHVNGKNNDHRIENLRFLCPNCHSITETYAGKNKTHIPAKQYYCIDCGKQVSIKGTVRCIECNAKNNRKIKRPSREELKNMIRSTSFVAIGRQFNVSDNTIRKWCKSYNLPLQVSEIKTYSEEEWKKV